MRIKKRTVRRLRTAASKFFPPEEHGVDPYHTWIEAEFGVDSTLDLTEAQAVQAIKDIDRMRKERAKVLTSRRVDDGRLSDDQMDYIKGLFDYLGIKEKHRQIGFIEKQIGSSKVIEWLTVKEASKVITGLRRWKRDEAKENSK